MPRPPKYTDDDIAGAIDSLIGEGKEVNPSRIKQRLGGGNIERIKAVIDRRGVDPGVAEQGGIDLPPPVLAELRRHNDQSQKVIQRLVTELWNSARDEAQKGKRDEGASLRGRILELEKELSRSNGSVRELERNNSKERQEREKVTKDRNELSEQCRQLTAALRNAESDLRASERVISVLERSQRQDRDEIRSLQKRVEELLTELTSIRMKN